MGGGGLALLYAVHRNLGPDGAPRSNVGPCGPTLVDFRVDVGLVFLAEGRAFWGQVKNVAIFFT